MAQSNKLVATLVAALFSAGAYAADMSDAAIKERIAPVGSVTVAGAEPAAAAGGARSGADIYNTVCTTCHTSGLLGAPKKGAAADWAPRMEKGLDQVVAKAVAGFGAMPAKGGCADCSDDDIKAAVEHMIEGI